MLTTLLSLGVATLAKPTSFQTPAPVPRKFHVILEFSDARDREAWIQPGQCMGPTKDSWRSKRAFIDISLVGANPGEHLFIWDHKTGRLALVLVRSLAKSRHFKVGDADFTHLASVTVEVRRHGQPSPDAKVILEDKAHRIGEVLERADRGTLTFFDISPGPVKVNVTYRGKGSAELSLTRSFRAELSHRDPAARWTIDVPG